MTQGIPYGEALATYAPCEFREPSTDATATETLLRGFSAPSFANRDVGFRCCRSAQ